MDINVYGFLLCNYLLLSSSCVIRENILHVRIMDAFIITCRH